MEIMPTSFMKNETPPCRPHFYFRREEKGQEGDERKKNPSP